MNQVITNLIVNAIHYSNSGDEIRESLGIVQQNGQPFATLQICDTGIGIAPEMQERAFEPFVRASENGESGTGLGLTIRRESITQHDGSTKLERPLSTASTLT